MKSKITPEQAQALLDKHDLNMITKVTAGKPLTKQEQAELRALAGKKPRGQTGTDEGKRPQRIEADYEKALRRRRVFELRLRGLSIRDMAAELGVDKKTVNRDLRDLDAEEMGLINPREGRRIMVETIRTYDMLIKEATANAAAATTENGRAGFMNIIDRASQNRAKLLQELGAVEVAPIRVETSGPNGAPIETVTMERGVSDDEIIELLKRTQTGQG